MSCSPATFGRSSKSIVTDTDGRGISGVRHPPRENTKAFFRPVHFELLRHGPTQSGSTVSYEVPPLGFSMEKRVNGCLSACMLSLGTCTQVCGGAHR